MAERRMFAKAIIDSDAFIDMPATARLLYYDLAMRADDDGFVNNPKKIMAFVGAKMDDLQVLATKKFIIPFDNGIVVIKHWRIHNYIRKDTYTETNYKEEKALLELDGNKAYRLSSTARGRLVDGSSTQVSIGKVSIDNINTIAQDEAQNEAQNLPQIPQYFEVFWEAYPRKRDKGEAKIVFAKLKVDDALLAKMIDALNKAKQTEQWTKEKGTFIPYPAKWLRGECWEDDYTVSSLKRSAEGRVINDDEYANINY